MAIVGNVFLPPLTGRIMDEFPAIYQIAYIVPLVCFIFCGYYGWRGHRVVD
jgi:FHS family L-fucose permease-like MFS transporter